MVTICKAPLRALKCRYKENAETPDEIPCIVCAKEASPEECKFAKTVSKWVREGFGMKEVKPA